MKSAESLSPVTKKLGANESTEKLGEVIEKPQPESSTPQPSIEHTPSHQRIENNEGVTYDTELENTLNNMKNIIGFFKTYEDPEGG